MVSCIQVFQPKLCMHFSSLLWLLHGQLILLTFIWLHLCTEYKQKFVCYNAEWIELNEISVEAGFGGYCGEPSGFIIAYLCAGFGSLIYTAEGPSWIFSARTKIPPCPQLDRQFYDSGPSSTAIQSSPGSAGIFWQPNHRAWQFRVCNASTYGLMPSSNFFPPCKV